MGITVKVSDMQALRRKLKALEKAPQKVINSTIGDMKKRGPSWIATEVSQEYGIKKAEITGQKAGKVRVRGESLENIQIN